MFKLFSPRLLLCLPHKPKAACAEKADSRSLKQDKNARLDRLLQIHGDDEVVWNLMSISRQRQERGATASSAVALPSESNSNNSIGEQPVANIYSLDGSVHCTTSTNNIMLPETDIRLHDGFDSTIMDQWYEDGEQNDMDNGDSSFQDFDFNGIGFLEGVDGRTPAALFDSRHRVRDKSTQNPPLDISEGILNSPLCEDQERRFSLTVSASTADKLYVAVFSFRRFFFDMVELTWSQYRHIL